MRLVPAYRTGICLIKNMWLFLVYTAVCTIQRVVICTCCATAPIVFMGLISTDGTISGLIQCVWLRFECIAAAAVHFMVVFILDSCVLPIMLRLCRNPARHHGEDHNGRQYHAEQFSYVLMHHDPSCILAFSYSIPLKSMVFQTFRRK